MGRTKGSRSKTSHIWTIEEKEYLRQVTQGHHYKEIMELMNKKFSTGFKITQIRAAVKRYELNTGFTGRFPKGHIPANKGIKGIRYKGTEKTWFKKGSIPLNHRPVGSERIDVDGYTEVKIEEPNKWRLKHQLIWEKEKGPIPKGHAVIFGDGNKNNLDINNLILVSRQQLLIVNRKGLIQSDADLTRTAVIIANIYQKISKMKKYK